MAVVHTVLFKMRRPEDAERGAERLRAMAGRIEGVRSLEVGLDQLGGPRSWHLALTVRVDDWDALEAYAEHPEHVPVKTALAEAAEEVAVVDYEV